MPDFPTIIAAIRPQERTTQFVVLAALYSLGAATRTVTASELDTLLDLHLRGKRPAQLPKLLRRYAAYVRVADEGPPLRWALTEAGLGKLRAWCKLVLPVETKTLGYDFDVGIVCALEKPEFAAVLSALGGEPAWKEIGDARFPHVYRQTSMKTASGANLRVVGGTATSMGLTAAAIFTTQLIMQFRPRIVVMTGIAAGTRDGGKQFGDVLIADPSVYYNSGKVVEKDGIRDFLPDPYPLGLNARLRSVLQKYRGTHKVFSEIRQKWHGAAPPEANRLHLGPLGAADQVIDDPTRVEEVRKNWRKLIGVEMETYAVYRACSEAPEPKPRYISFKSVCDFAAEKADSWQAYAAFVAAEFATRFLHAE